ncbi:hypothetical protein BZA77DRAFT_254940 [Pyronema omphalodes]|nr:hypothetical protein BZA77DRAFT_254940 [Pyronema omphalodes]
MLSGYTANTPRAGEPTTPPRVVTERAPRHVRGASVPVTSPLSPTSPTGVISPYNSANRGSYEIVGTSSLKKDDVKHLRNSSVSHFRTLSRLTDEDSAREFGGTVDTGEEVAGMHGRKRLQRAPTENMTSWERMTWMDKRRQYIQAYEYLCHIGEAKEWMEDCIGEPIPPIVELEEALRDGVALAKLTRVFAPELVPRIFQSAKLQFRHSDNIDRFFRFLRKVELPEIFFFETTDLYNKKNIPKVIYCIHALSFLLFRLGLTNHAIGNLVGKLEFTEQEIQKTQKGLDIAGVSLPSFRGVNKHFEVEEPEPVESEEDRVNRELKEMESAILGLQAWIRGSMLRMRLGDLMEELWDAEYSIMFLQARIRGMFARTAYNYHADVSSWASTIQAQARGFLARQQFREQQKYCSKNQDIFARLQAHIRGNKLREQLAVQRLQLERKEKPLTALQSNIRGFLVRQRLANEADEVYENEPAIASLQSLARAAIVRRNLAKQLSAIAVEEEPITKLQAAVRGALVRKQMQQDSQAMEEEEEPITELVAKARGALVRKHHQERLAALAEEEEPVTRLQSAIRGYLVRQNMDEDQEALEEATDCWTELQALIRGALVRWEYRHKIICLFEAEDEIIDLQALAQGFLVRQAYDCMLDELDDSTEEVIELQAKIRGAMLRLELDNLLLDLKDEEESIIGIQAHIRGFMLRWKLDDLHADLKAEEDAIVELQAAIRGATIRYACDEIVLAIRDEEEAILELQAAARGHIQRTRFQSKLKHYRDNMDKVIKLQSYVRTKQMGEAYKSLMSDNNPPVNTVKNFVHLLNDSDFDFEQEIKFEELRKEVVRHVRANDLAESYVEQLDVKIALLVKNKITLDEVIKHQKHFTGHVGNILSNTGVASSDPFDLKALNKASKNRLEKYQQMFYALQTEPQYLSRLFLRIREQNTPDKELKRVENLVMGIFGYSQKRREEFYLLKLIARSIQEEVSRCSRPEDFLRGNFFYVKIVNSYIRSPRDRKFLRLLLGPLINEEFINNEHLDLESDPLQIHRASINNEELRTGQRSTRDPNLPRHLAITDAITRAEFIRHLEQLKELSLEFLRLLENNIDHMPYGIRYIASQSLAALIERFPEVSHSALSQIVLHFVYQKYLSPALNGPDAFGIAAKSLSPRDKKNLTTFSKLMNQISLGRVFAQDDMLLQPLNEFVVSMASPRFRDGFKQLINIPEISVRYGIDEFEDLTAKQRPTLYIKMADIFSIHSLVASELEYICEPGDAMRDTIQELGSVQANEADLKLAAGEAEICLQLDARARNLEDPESERKQLWVETKRCILYIIRVQQGRDLMEILVKPVTAEDEERWDELREEEERELKARGKSRRAYGDTAVMDIHAMSYAQLKRLCLESILQLEHLGLITRTNNYQDLLSSIATDIRLKSSRRKSRSSDIARITDTLADLSKKTAYLESQLASYNDYIDQAMLTLHAGKGARPKSGVFTGKGLMGIIHGKGVMPFSRQWSHMRELEKQGRVPKFGSYKYTAKQLAEKGVLVEMVGWDREGWGRVEITIGSDEVGVFCVEVTEGQMVVPGEGGRVRLEDMLQMQFHGNQFMLLCDGMLKFNVNLFLHLIFRKFYRDE